MSVTACPTCGYRVEFDMTNCPNCNSPVNKSTDLDELDSFLDDAISSMTESKDNELDFSLPDMDYVDGVTEQSTNISTELDSDLDFSLPDMDYVDGVTEQSTNISSELDSVEDIAVSPPPMDYKESPQPLEAAESIEIEESVPEEVIEAQSVEPSHIVLDDIALSEVPKEVPEISVSEEIFIEIQTTGTMSNITFKQKLWLYSSQFIYWGLVFFLISSLSLEIISQNIRLEDLLAASYVLEPEGFILGWISFFAMGFFFSYKLRQHAIGPRYIYAILYLIFFSIFFISIMGIGVYYFNREILNTYIDDTGATEFTFNSYNYIPTSYFLIGLYNYLAYFLSSGWVLFLAGYRPLWEIIFKRTPMSSLRPELAG